MGCAGLGQDFHPLRLTKAASLNRTPLAALAGAEASWVGRRAYDVLRLEVLERLAAEHGILADQRTNVPRRLRAALGAADHGEANDGQAERGEAGRARLVVAEFGRRLGHLAATLRLGDDDSCEWRTVFEGAAEWRAAYRRHWRSVEHVWLGGGVVAALGAELVDAARAEARKLGLDAAMLKAASHADVLALLGAARTRATPAPRAVVLDFGYSSVKRGIAHFAHGGALQQLEVLSPIPLVAIGLGSQSTGEQVMRAVVDVIRAVFKEAHEEANPLDNEVSVSLATYLTDRQPFPTSELYDLLTAVDFATLSAELARATGRPLHVRYIHDGTAAAAALDTTGHDGIIVVGTSLGAGFTLPDQPRLPIAVDLAVTRS